MCGVVACNNVSGHAATFPSIQQRFLACSNTIQAAVIPIGADGHLPGDLLELSESDGGAYLLSVCSCVCMVADGNAAIGRQSMVADGKAW